MRRQGNELGQVGVFDGGVDQEAVVVHDVSKGHHPYRLHACTRHSSLRQTATGTSGDKPTSSPHLDEARLEEGVDIAPGWGVRQQVALDAGDEDEHCHTQEGQA